MMKPYPRKRYTLLALSLLLITGTLIASAIWIRSEQRRYALGGQLITALYKHDTTLALALVNSGADPNTPFEALPRPTLNNLWQSLLRQKPSEETVSRTVFEMVCGAHEYHHMGDIGWEFGLGVDDPQLTESMLRHGAHMRPRHGQLPPIFWAIVGHNPRTLEVLIRHGADVNARATNVWTFTSDTPIMADAVNTTDAEITRILIAHGADVNAKNELGKTALLMAAYANSSSQKIAMLIASGADVNAQDSSGATALYLTIQFAGDMNRYPNSRASAPNSTGRQTIRELLTHGADPNLPTKTGDTPLKLARSKYLSDLVALMQRTNPRVKVSKSNGH